MNKFKTGNMTATKAIRKDDFYASPYEAIPPLLVAEGKRLPKDLWEPACGNGAIVVPLRNRGYDVIATDLRDWGCPDSNHGIDFLDAFSQSGANDKLGIVTNPPFSIIKPFIETATNIAPYVAILARLAFLEAESRMAWWGTVGLSRVHVISDRLPMMHRYGYVGPKLMTSGMAYSWFIFEQKKQVFRSAKATVDWVSWKSACVRHPRNVEDIPPPAREKTHDLFEAHVVKGRAA